LDGWTDCPAGLLRARIVWACRQASSVPGCQWVCSPICMLRLLDTIPRLWRRSAWLRPGQCR
jgi:hypothetical protein